MSYLQNITLFSFKEDLYLSHSGNFCVIIASNKEEKTNKNIDVAGYSCAVFAMALSIFYNVSLKLINCQLLIT